MVTAMAYTILKLHKKAIMKLNDMDLIVNYIQVGKYLYYILEDNEFHSNFVDFRGAFHRFDFIVPFKKLPCYAYINFFCNIG